MIVPLVLGHRAQGDPELLAEARRLCRHVARSAWTDESGATRYHRYWYVRGERALKTDTPMLIAGMGLTLYGIHEVLAEGPDAELEAFTEACLATSPATRRRPGTSPPRAAGTTRPTSRPAPPGTRTTCCS